jgi:uncharacterized protein (UPF0264 family)
MPALLISVRDVDEAAAAVAGGADIIDLKEPLRGSLGRADAHVWRQVTQRVGTRVPISAALGELLDERPPCGTQDWAGVRFVKWGLAGCRRRPDWPNRWAAAKGRLPPGLRSVGVIYVDAEAAAAPEPGDVLCHAARLGCWGILFDTHGKDQGSLFDLMPAAQLDTLIQAAHDHSMAAALAGSLADAQIRRAVQLAPDLIAVRTAACVGGRNGRVSEEKVRRLAQIISRASPLHRTAVSASAIRHFGGAQNA